MSCQRIWSAGFKSLRSVWPASPCRPRRQRRTSRSPPALVTPRSCQPCDHRGLRSSGTPHHWGICERTARTNNGGMVSIRTECASSDVACLAVGDAKGKDAAHAGGRRLHTDRCSGCIRGSTCPECYLAVRSDRFSALGKVSRMPYSALTSRWWPFSLAWAAARRAIGTRYGEQLT